jgi:Peptidase family M23
MKIHALTPPVTLFDLLLWKALQSARRTKRIIFRFLPLLCFPLSNPLFALELEQPIDCEMGTHCFIQNYVDKEAGEAWKDYTCGILTYDKHKGTDFRVRNLADMRTGVDVTASASGTVQRVRNNMPDVDARQTNPESYKDKECGNGVVIEHGDGWETQYCHMMQGSVIVEKGQHVKTGQKLGQVGLSGKTMFPHVHLSVRHNGEHLDPFTRTAMETGCDLDRTDSLWSEQARKKLPYISTALLNMGIVDKVPKPEEVRSEHYRDDTISKASQYLIVWFDIMGVRKGDQLQLTITRPQGKEQLFEEIIEKPKALYFFYAGLKIRQQAGIYRMHAKLVRPQGKNDGVIFERSKEVVVN